MATRNEAKAAIWAASKRKDAAAKAFLTKFIAENSVDGPGGYVPDDKLATAVKAVK